MAQFHGASFVFDLSSGGAVGCGCVCACLHYYYFVIFYLMYEGSLQCCCLRWYTLCSQEHRLGPDDITKKVYARHWQISVYWTFEQCYNELK